MGSWWVLLTVFGTLTESDIHKAPIYAMEPQSFQAGKQEDSAAFFDLLFRRLISVTSDPTPENYRAKLLALEVHQDTLYNQAVELRDLDHDSRLHFECHLQGGYDSPLYHAFAIQVVKEAVCPDVDPPCERVKRWFNHAPRFDLHFHDSTTATTLQSMLGHFLKHVTDRTSTIEPTKPCVDLGHAGALRAHPRVTITSAYLFMRFTRGNDGSTGKTYSNHVDVPEFLDMVSFID